MKSKISQFTVYSLQFTANARLTINNGTTLDRLCSLPFALCPVAPEWSL